MSTLRVVVSDDEPVAASGLADMLRGLGCEVVAVTARGHAAIEACRAWQPDACFTDIVMPDQDGLAVATALRSAAPQTAVVFVSAYAQFAVAAFGADVVDYVLKPARPERLAEAVARVRRARTETPQDRLVVTERGAAHVVAVADIEWVQADGYSAWLHTPGRSWLLRERMHRLEERLASAGFIRVHRSALVRRDAIVSVEQGTEPVVVLRSGARVRVAADRLGELRALLRP